MKTKNEAAGIVHTYEGVTITYNESDNNWGLTLRGRDRVADSLKQAKEFIDKPVKEKAKPFERFEAYKVTGWSGGSIVIKPVTVTSIAAPSGYRHSPTEVWVTDEKKERSKCNASDVHPSTSYNVERVQGIEKLCEQIKGLQEQVYKLRKELKPYVIPKEDGE